MGTGWNWIGPVGCRLQLGSKQLDFGAKNIEELPIANPFQPLQDFGFLAKSTSTKGKAQSLDLWSGLVREKPITVTSPKVGKFDSSKLSRAPLFLWLNCQVCRATCAVNSSSPLVLTAASLHHFTLHQLWLSIKDDVKTGTRSTSGGFCCRRVSLCQLLTDWLSHGNTLKFMKLPQLAPIVNCAIFRPSTAQLRPWPFFFEPSAAFDAGPPGFSTTTSWKEQLWFLPTAKSPLPRLLVTTCWVIPQIPVFVPNNLELLSDAAALLALRGIGTKSDSMSLSRTGGMSTSHKLAVKGPTLKPSHKDPSQRKPLLRTKTNPAVWYSGWQPNHWSHGV